jgi:hypothetical protein
MVKILHVLQVNFLKYWSLLSKKGNYKVFVYEDCSTCPSGVKEVIIPVEITNNNQIVDLDTIDIKKL